MKYTLGLIYALFIIAVPFFIIANTVCLITDSSQLYIYGFKKFHISEVTGIELGQLETISERLIDYFDSTASSPQLIVTGKKGSTELYSPKELIHLEDVRQIIEKFRILQIWAGLFLVLAVPVILIESDVFKVLKGLQIGSFFAIVITVTLITWAAVDFDSIFYLFHIVSFSNDLWLLDPTKDYLIMMFPEGFFYDSAIILITAILVQAVVLCIPAFFSKKKREITE